MKDIALQDSIASIHANVRKGAAAAVGLAELWWNAIVTTLIPVSLLWDYSWESSIGVDRIWSPPHLATHIGIWLSGLLGLQFIARFTLARRHGGSPFGVIIGPLCGPSGAWILLWGALAFQCAFLFDNWWQKAYGLGAGLWHPPQILKATAFVAVLLGGLTLSAAAQAHGQVKSATPFVIWHGGLLVTQAALMLAMTNLPNLQHTAHFFEISSAIYPGLLLIVATASGIRWGVTGVALVYSMVSGVMVWLLPLFPAQPLTAPIHNPMDHLMPPTFPLLLLVPAVVVDWLRARFTSKVGWQAEFARAGAVGLAFVAVFLPVQWCFASFLLSPAADSWFFAGGGKHWPFFLKIDEARVMFWGAKQDPLTLAAILWSAAAATLSTAAGIRIGTWLRNLHR